MGKTFLLPKINGRATEGFLEDLAKVSGIVKTAHA